ncbi:hypothetical protein O3P69_018230 [Scylla paramamosain]|uniref:Ionotropic glutamate receptor C-terminal domain-containing protein n=1 Tax=Scylla paramamosain TaxID=85552 RepID=A0AAW0TLM0_SCYPA
MEASPERVYGEPLPNGSWTGLMGMLQRREANVTGTLLSVTWLRTQVVDFSEYLDIDEFTALHSRPALTSDVTGLVRPFTYQTWLFLLLSLISAFAVTLIVVQRHQGLVAPREEQQRRHGKADWRINLKESWLWTWCGLLGQSVPQQPEGQLVRVVVGQWMLFSFILAIVYRCVLKAMLILPRVHLPFDNLEQLVQTGIHVAVGEGTSIHVEIMLAANTSSVGQLRDVVVPVPAKHTKLYNLKVMEGHLAGMRTRTVANFIVNDDFAKVGVCRAYIMSRGFFGPNILSIAFPKGSQLKQQFDSM